MKELFIRWSNYCYFMLIARKVNTSEDPMVVVVEYEHASLTNVAVAELLVQALEIIFVAFISLPSLSTHFYTFDHGSARALGITSRTHWINLSLLLSTVTDRSFSQDRIAEHAKAFDSMLSLIPPKYYIAQKTQNPVSTHTHTETIATYIVLYTDMGYRRWIIHTCTTSGKRLMWRNKSKRQRRRR